jgi:hypothetical protein
MGFNPGVSSSYEVADFCFLFCFFSHTHSPNGSVDFDSNDAPCHKQVHFVGLVSKFHFEVT